MGRATPKNIPEWMKKFWIYDIGSGESCTMGCKCCKHTELCGFFTKVKARFVKDFKPKFAHNFEQTFGRP